MTPDPASRESTTDGGAVPPRVDTAGLSGADQALAAKSSPQLWRAHVRETARMAAEWRAGGNSRTLPCSQSSVGGRPCDSSPHDQMCIVEVGRAVRSRVVMKITILNVWASSAGGRSRSECQRLRTGGLLAVKRVGRDVSRSSSDSRGRGASNCMPSPVGHRWGDTDPCKYAAAAGTTARQGAGLLVCSGVGVVAFPRAVITMRARAAAAGNERLWSTPGRRARELIGVRRHVAPGRPSVTSGRSGRSCDE